MTRTIYGSISEEYFFIMNQDATDLSPSDVTADFGCGDHGSKCQNILLQKNASVKNVEPIENLQTSQSKATDSFMNLCQFSTIFYAIVLRDLCYIS